MRKLLTPIAVVLGALLTPTPALADAPIIEPVPAEDFVIAEGEMCEFAVSVEILVNREKSITFLDDEGNFDHQLVTGALRYELTNLSTGGSIVFNIPGPGRFSPNPDGTFRLANGRAAASHELWPLELEGALLERLALGDLDEVEDFVTRLDILHLLALREAGGLGSFLGGRIRLFPHQLHVAERATASDPGRSAHSRRALRTSPSSAA